MADVLIRGMGMPTEQYGKMLITLYPDGHVAEYVGDMGRVWDAVPLPEGHGRLIDADELDDAFTALRFNEDGSLNHWDDRKNWCLHGSEIETILSNAPTIVPAEGGGEDADK